MRIGAERAIGVPCDVTDADAAKRWAALVFGSHLLSTLSEDEMMVLARHGGAVSPVTSYLAIEPDKPGGYGGKAWNVLRWKGDTRAAHAIMETMPARTRPGVIVDRVWIEIYDGARLVRT